MSNPHYTFVDQIGNKIFHRYWDGEPKIEEISEFPIELFIKGAREDSRGIYGEKLSRVDFTSMSDAREFIKSHGDVMPIHGQTSWAHQFISKRYPDTIKFDFANFKIVALDIETKFTDEFPHPAKAAQEITAITCKIFGENKFYTWGLMPFQKTSPQDEYWLCSTETDMLASFINWWNRLKPDIITGWNIVGFDVPYIINRLKRVLGDHQAAKFSPLNLYTSKVFTEIEVQKGQMSYRVAGLNIYDYLEIYKKFSTGSRENYKLDTIAQLELGEEKLDYSEYGNLMDLYRNNHQKYIEYNQHDVRLIEMLDNKRKFLFLAITLAYMGKVKFHEIFGQVKFWDNLVYVELLKKNIQIPPHIHKSSEGTIEGAYVKDPEPGLYKWVTAFDLTSLYPSIIMALNMSPETIVDGDGAERILEKLIDMQVDLSHLKAHNLSMAANGSTYDRSKNGIMPEITANMFAGRKAYKNLMLDKKREAEAVKKELASRGVRV